MMNDTAVIEIRYEDSGEWVIVCYIGTDRENGELDYMCLFGAKTIRYREIA